MKKSGVFTSLVSFSFFVLLFSSNTYAGSPYVTDDPETVEPGHYELSIASQEIKTERGRSGTLPHVEFNYGLMPDVQLHAQVPMSFNQTPAGQRTYGLGDAEIGIKYRFLQETDTQPMMGIYPILVSASGDAAKGLGNGGTQLYLPVWLQKNWGDWQSNAGVGYWINHAPGAENHWYIGWQLQHDISARLTLGGELFHLTEQQNGQGASTGFNLGVTYNFDEHNHVLFSAGRALVNANRTNQFSSYLAYLWTW